MVQNTGWCIWVTGLPGSGKSTVSTSLMQLLPTRTNPVQLLSSDTLRKVLTPVPTYSPKERDRVYAVLVYIAKLLTQNGVNVIIDATGNFRRYRRKARSELKRFAEIYLKCPLEICVNRETNRLETYDAPKQIYKQHSKEKASTVPGVGVKYEPPLNPELVIDTVQNSPCECAKKILQLILRFK